ncbi:hypothetical protein JTE90_008576 [Oedothorax gibbosus]|uniref:RNase H type-1 domain-containing protein n=1 Tax=Oedothorax gibbosus TaxID=931172 RepID=A0AAV6TKU6_9ARAC|nr:hypothetical protein JTE90_008576 [Oedothorax gibbosus]
MSINSDKTVCQRFTLSTKKVQVSVNYNNQNLKQVYTFRYLGVFLDSKLSWKNYAEETAKKGTPEYSLTIGISEKKCDTIFEALRAFSLEVMATKYPREEGIHIHTDGSAGDGNTGAGAYCEGFFEKSCAVGFHASNFDADIYTIKIAISNLLRLETNLRMTALTLKLQS